MPYSKAGRTKAHYRTSTKANFAYLSTTLVSSRSPTIIVQLEVGWLSRVVDDKDAGLSQKLRQVRTIHAIVFTM